MNWLLYHNSGRYFDHMDDEELDSEELWMKYVPEHIKITVKIRDFAMPLMFDMERGTCNEAFTFFVNDVCYDGVSLFDAFYSHLPEDHLERTFGDEVRKALYEKLAGNTYVKLRDFPQVYL